MVALVYVASYVPMIQHTVVTNTNLNTAYSNQLNVHCILYYFRINYSFFIVQFPTYIRKLCDYSIRVFHVHLLQSNCLIRVFCSLLEYINLHSSVFISALFKYILPITNIINVAISAPIPIQIYVNISASPVSVLVHH